MRHMLMLSGAIAMVIAAPALAQNKGHDGGKSKGDDAHMSDKGHGKDAKEARKSYEKAVENQAKAYEKDAKDYRKSVDKRDKDYDKFVERRAKEYRKAAKADAKDYRDAEKDYRKQAERDGNRYYEQNRQQRVLSMRALIEGCPPGLAMKNNGCLPPGQAKKMYDRSDRYAVLFDRIPTRYRDYGDDYRYNDGYLYRSQGNSIVSWLPLLGGALGVGNIFPANYAAREMPVYYDAYYGRNDNYDYRYADRAIFAVDPKTQAIQSIAALLTGDDWTVGQRAPSGYDVYNVPLAYRDRYVDTPDADYRYADGHVYRIDPKTQLVAAAISLLT